jgi:hypothetical protein
MARAEIKIRRGSRVEAQSKTQRKKEKAKNESKRRG